jgi:hypothetical protein
MTLEQENEFFKIKKLIDDKREELNCRSDHLSFIGDTIKVLNGFILGCDNLSDEDIGRYLGDLIQYRVVLDIPIPIGTLFVRAVRVDNSNTYPKYCDVGRLSYIPNNKLHLAKLGRFNKVGQSMYYGCVSQSIKNSTVAFAEIDSKATEHINILLTRTTEENFVRFIGLFDYYRSGVKPPIPVHEIFEEIYNYYKVTHEEELLMAIDLCDAFFRDVSTKKGNERVYKITSQLSNLLLESESVDGLIYPSVEGGGSPNVVIKPTSIDKKTKHEEAHIVLIKQNYGYGYYRVIEFDDGAISNNVILWKKDQ